MAFLFDNCEFRFRGVSETEFLFRLFYYSKMVLKGCNFHPPRKGENAVFEGDFLGGCAETSHRQCLQRIIAVFFHWFFGSAGKENPAFRIFIYLLRNVVLIKML